MTSTKKDGVSTLTISRTNGEVFTFSVQDGGTPIKGVDYWTETDKSEIIAEATAKVSQLVPLTADTIDKCTDTTKPYLLPDGYIYIHKKKETPTEAVWSENLVPTSIDTDGSIFNGKGYQDECRLNSSGVVTSQANSTAIGFIPAKKGDKFQITGVRFGISSTAGVYGYISLYDANKTKVSSASLDVYRESPSTYGYTVTPLITSGTVLPTDVITVDMANIPTNVAFVRFSSSIQIVNGFEKQSGAQMVVQKWTEGGTEVTEGWENSGHAFVPADYEDRIIALENLIADLQARL